MNEHHHIPRAFRPPRRKRRGWLVLLVVILALYAWFGRFAYLRITLRPTPRPDYWQAQLQALDPPGPGAITWTQAYKILAKPPQLAPPPASQPSFGPDASAALPSPRVVRQVVLPRPSVGPDASAALLPPGTGFLAASPNPPEMRSVLEGPWDPTRSAIKAADQLFQSAAFNSSRESMRKALQAGWWDDTVGMLPGTIPSSLRSYREWTTCLMAHARWAREHDHDSQAATDDWLMTLRLARQVRRSHCLLPELTATAIDGLVAREMGLAAREGCVPAETATLARQIDAIRGGAAELSKMVDAARIGERCQLEYCFVREGGDWVDVSSFANMARIGRWGGAAGSASRLWNVASPLFHDYETACRNVEQYWAVAATRNNMRAWFAEREKEPTDSFEGVLDGEVFRLYARNSTAMLRCYAGATHVEASMTMLGLAAYHRKHARYPDSLTQLVPDFLPRLPVDYADRGVLRYRREGNDYILYSVGPDGADDGGKSTNTSYPEDIYSNVDLVYSRVVREKETP
ncbi:MAG: hypothetical protein KA354_05600 [Phycisphaerae bacterium]|nr:hypothetical protein [Phycisphaerae bacterium]